MKNMEKLDAYAETAQTINDNRKKEWSRTKKIMLGLAIAPPLIVVGVLHSQFGMSLSPEHLLIASGATLALYGGELLTEYQGMKEDHAQKQKNQEQTVVARPPDNPPTPASTSWQQTAYEHLDQAQKHLDTIAMTPAVREYAKIASMPNLPTAKKIAYEQAIYNNNPDLMQHYDHINHHIEQAQQAIHQGHQTGMAEPVLDQKADYLRRSANQLPGTMRAAIDQSILHDLTRSAIHDNKYSHRV